MPQKEIAFKSKHKLDLGNVSFDQRGKEVLGFSESEFACKGIYDIVHPDDLAYVASAHAECKYYYLRIIFSNELCMRNESVQITLYTK